MIHREEGLEQDVEVAAFAGYTTDPINMRIKIWITQGSTPCVMKGQFSCRCFLSGVMRSAAD